MCSLHCKYKLNSMSGTTLVELLVSLCLASLICVVAGKMLVGTTQMSSVIKTKYQDDITEVQIIEKLQKVLDDLDSHPFNIFPRVHKSGRLTFRDGFVNHINSYKLEPSPDSDAITAMSLALENIYEVQYQTGNVYFACPRFKGVSFTENNFGYIGLGSDGIFEMQGKGSGRLGRGGCGDFVLNSTNGMLLESPDVSSDIVRLLIPIKSYYTLYVDKNEQLRYVSHRGKSIVENQPLFSNVRSLKIKRKIRWNSIVCLSANIEFSDHKTKSFQNCNRFGRYDYFNFIFNKI